MGREITAEIALIAYVLKYMKWPEGKDYCDIRSEFYKICERLYVQIDRDSVNHAEWNHWSVELKKALDEPTKVAPISESLYYYVSDHLRWNIEHLDVVTDVEMLQLKQSFLPQMTHKEYAKKWMHRNGFSDEEMVNNWREQIVDIQIDINKYVEKAKDKVVDIHKLIADKPESCRAQSFQEFIEQQSRIVNSWSQEKKDAMQYTFFTKVDDDENENN